MQVYTLQPQTALELLLAGRPYRPDPDLCRAEGFLDDSVQIIRAYDWITAKLALQDTSPEPNALPVWVWQRFDSARPDLRRHRPYSPGVLLELEVNPARVLLSDFDLWHASLNGHLLGTDQEDKAFDLECQRRGFSGHDTFWQDTELAEQVMKSWERCLDLDWYAPDWFGVPRDRKKIQGVIWEIRPEDLVHYRFYQGWKWRD